MAKHTELAELIAEAVESVTYSLSLGDSQGHKERWRSQDYKEHHRHAMAHADADEIDQAICRLLMARVMLRRKG